MGKQSRRKKERREKARAFLLSVLDKAIPGEDTPEFQAKLKELEASLDDELINQYLKEVKIKEQTNKMPKKVFIKRGRK